MRLSFLPPLQFDIPEIDQAHERMIHMLNEINDCMEGENFDAALRQVIHLIAVERKHVATENSLLEQQSYYGIDLHTLHHQSLNHELVSLMSALGDQNIDDAEKIFKKVRKNFLDDIMLADLPFKSLLQHRILGR